MFDYLLCIRVIFFQTNIISLSGSLLTHRKHGIFKIYWMFCTWLPAPPFAHTQCPALKKEKNRKVTPRLFPSAGAPQTHLQTLDAVVLHLRWRTKRAGSKATIECRRYRGMRHHLLTEDMYFNLSGLKTEYATLHSVNALPTPHNHGCTHKSSQSPDCAAVWAVGAFMMRVLCWLARTESKSAVNAVLLGASTR